ncbi:MAG: hypothetical protein M0R74_15605 [Dehalococcoidia bacterium]|nr:hypothetical protein [Dehalococcoidia bacterium]
MAHAVQQPESHSLPDVADAHAEEYDTREQAPVHYEIKEYFGSTQTFIAGLMGVVAIAGGIIFGLVLANN